MPSSSKTGYEDDQPLNLTVHSVAAPQPLDPERTRQGRLKMLLVMLLCAAPVVASYTSYYWLRPQTQRKFGDLIEPQRPLPDVVSHTLDGKALNLRTLKAQWLLISVAGGACDTVCTQNLYFQRQLRESLGADKDRMDWVWLVDDEAAVPSTLDAALKTATVLRVAHTDLAQWLEPASGHKLSDHLYLVDPMGNWMMRFPATVNKDSAPKIKRDLGLLMRASASWDTDGR